MQFVDILQVKGAQQSSIKDRKTHVARHTPDRGPPMPLNSRMIKSLSKGTNQHLGCTRVHGRKLG